MALLLFVMICMFLKHFPFFNCTLRSFYTARLDQLTQLVQECHTLSVSRRKPIFIDSLDSLLVQYSAEHIFEWLHSLITKDVGPIFTVVHQESQDRHIKQLIEYSANIIIDTQPASATGFTHQRGLHSTQPSFACRILQKRPCKISKVFEMMTLNEDEMLSMVVESDISTAKAAQFETSSVESTSQGTSRDISNEEKTSKLALLNRSVPFNLKLTEKQKENRRSVALPYVHQGQSDKSIFEDNQDDQDDDLTI